LHATPQNDFARGIKPGDAAAVLTQINAENRDIHGCAPCFRIAPYQLSRRGGPSIRGEHKQAVGRSRGGRNTKIHALADAKGRLLAILLTGGEAHDCPVAERLIRRVKPPKRMLGDKAYDSAELREDLDERGTRPVIPNRCNRKQPFSFSKRLYKLRWRIESAFNRLKDFRRIATRYDRLARNYLASVCLAAALVWRI
jgi:transposase